jgi:hypothetical protein
MVPPDPKLCGRKKRLDEKVAAALHLDKLGVKLAL